MEAGMGTGTGYRSGMIIQEIDESQLVAAAPVDACMVDVEVKSSDVGVTPVVAVETVTGKRKRGRPPRGEQRPAPPPPVKKEEDVCFICFDGGSLVLCDRKGCPKAYHPACIKRDEAFFQSKAKWTCGWHICSTCQKSSSYMCYTCPYSSCKGCIKNADFTYLRGNKGLCETCMRTIMLIENIEPTSKENVQVDFDDKTSWEYLFKVYWVCLKTELSLTADELINAPNPCKGNDLQKARHLWDGAYPITAPVCDLHRNSINSTNINNHMQLVDKENSLSVESSIVDISGSLPPQEMAWATKELLEFVAYMKNGDVSKLSQPDVQALLLDYIKGNNLRDPLEKSQVVCDSRLITLFGKARIGHIEMLKLLKYHFGRNEKPNIEETVRAGVGGAVSSSLQAAECSINQVILSSDRRHKSRINPNSTIYAAIDVHNINLLYLKRSSVENLLDDADKFHGTVVGSFVRIKISGGDQKSDAYRLVTVVGTGRAAEVYTVGSRTTDLMLEILNLDCKEVVSVDGISNQDFSEDECRYLRQTIKCGLIKPLTVREILPKAMMLQEAKVSDALEAEILRLNHICDRANEMGQQKQLKECLERLKILKSPKERQRRLVEIPEVHADPKMDPSYEEDPIAKNVKKPGNRGRPRNSGHGSKTVNPNPVLQGGNNLNENGNRVQTRQAVPQSEMRLQIVSGLKASTQSRPAVVQSETSSQAAPMILPSSLQKGGEIFANDAETEKLWHYQDPTGRIQGPFAMMQLRKWSSNGLFPLDLRVWRTYEQQSDSILLTDALVGRFSQEPLFPQEVFSSSTNNDQRAESGLNLNQSTDTTSTDSKNVESNCKSLRDKNSSELLSTIFGSDSPSWTASVTLAQMENGQGSVQGLDLSKNRKSWTDEPQLGSKNASPPSSGKFNEILSPQVSNGDGDEKLTSDLCHVKSTVEGQSDAVKPEEKQAESGVYSSHSPGQNWGALPMNCSSSSRLASNSGIAPEKNVEKLIHQEFDLSDMPSTTTELSKIGSKGQLVENIQQASPNVPVQDSGTSWSTASSLVVGGQPRVVGNEWLMDTEFSLFDESVSDLLAEVEAMESLGGLPSPTSRMTFSLVDGFSPSHLDVVDEPPPPPLSGVQPTASESSTVAHEPTQSDSFDQSKNFGVQSSDSAKVDGNQKADVSVSLWQTGRSDVQPIASSHFFQGKSSTGSHRPATHPDAYSGSVKGNTNLNLNLNLNPNPNSVLPAKDNNTPWGTGHVTVQHQGSMATTSPRHHNGDSSPGMRESRSGYHQGRDSGFIRDRSSSWNRQQFGGVGGHSFRPPPKGQRICKFYESGYCRKGASCSYWHPGP